MSKTTAVTNYSKLSDSELLTQCQKTNKSLTGNANFKFEAERLSEFSSNILRFQDGILAAKDGGVQAINSKNIARQAVLDDLRYFGVAVNLQAEGDKEKLLTSGLTLSKDHAPKGVLPKPTGFDLDAGDNSGEIVCSVNALNSARMYCFYYAEAPAPANVSEWKVVMSTTRKKKITGLTSGKKYEFRCAYKGSEDEVIYSDLLTIYAQ